MAASRSRVARHPYRDRRLGEVAGRRFDLGEGPLDRVPTIDARHLGEHPQRDHERERLVRRQSQRAVDAGVVGDRDVVTVERHVDQVAGAVAGQAADPQQLQVLAQLALGDIEVGRGLAISMPGPGQQVGHQVQQPGQAVAGGVRGPSADLRRHRRRVALRVAARVMRVADAHGRDHLPEPLDHRLADLGRLQDLDVGAVTDDPGREPLGSAYRSRPRHHGVMSHPATSRPARLHRWRPPA